jgi:hypothetical protein
MPNTALVKSALPKVMPLSLKRRAHHRELAKKSPAERRTARNRGRVPIAGVVNGAGQRLYADHVRELSYGVLLSI